MTAWRRGSALLATLLCLAVGAARAENAPRRIISLGGGVTEIVYALGAGDRIVAVDAISTYPAPTHRLPQVGYLRTLGIEGLLSLTPDYVLAAHDAGPPVVLEKLVAAGIPLLRIPETKTPADIVEHIRLIGNAVGRKAEAETLAQAVGGDLAVVQAAVAKVMPVPALFVLSAGTGAPMAAGRGTVADVMLQLAGARNVAAGLTGYRPVTAESVLSLDPVVIVSASHVVAAVGGIERLRQLPELSGTRAAQARRIYSLDSLYLLGLGPRTAHAARDLAALLHGEAAIPTLPARPWTAPQ